LGVSYMPINGSEVHNRHFVPYEKAYSVSFSYTYKVPKKARRRLTNLFFPRSYIGSNTNTLTVILDSNGDQHKTLRPRRFLELSFYDLLLAAGLPKNELDLPQPAMKKQFGCGCNQGGPSRQAHRNVAPIRTSLWEHAQVTIWSTAWWLDRESVHFTSCIPARPVGFLQST